MATRGFFILTDNRLTSILLNNLTLFNNLCYFTNGIFLGSETKSKNITWGNSWIISNYNAFNYGLICFIYIQNRINNLFVNFFNNTIKNNNLSIETKGYAIVIWVYVKNFEIKLKNCVFENNENIAVLFQIYGLQDKIPLDVSDCIFINNTFEKIFELDHVLFTLTNSHILTENKYHGSKFYFSNSLIKFSKIYMENIESLSYPLINLLEQTICEMENITFKKVYVEDYVFKSLRIYSLNLKNINFLFVSSSFLMSSSNSKSIEIKNIYIDVSTIYKFFEMKSGVLLIENLMITNSIKSFLLILKSNALANFSKVSYFNNFPLKNIQSIFQSIISSLVLDRFVSEFSQNNITIENSYIESINSDIMIKNSILKGNNKENYFLTFSYGSFNLSNVTFLDNQYFLNLEFAFIIVINSLFNSRQNSNFNYTNNIPILIKKSNNLIIERTIFANFKGKESPIMVSSQTSNRNFFIKNCLFENLSSYSNGGALTVFNVKIIIINSEFRSNFATLNGGAVFMFCDLLSLSFCNYSLINNTFINNFANSSGGSYYWSLSKPYEINNTFTKNKAETSGENFASFFCRIGIQLILFKEGTYNVLFDSFNKNSSDKLIIRNIEKFNQTVFFKLFPLDYYKQKTNKKENTIITVNIFSKLYENSTKNQSKLCQNLGLNGKTSYTNFQDDFSYIFDEFSIKICPEIDDSLNFYVSNPNFFLFSSFENPNSLNEFVNSTSYFIEIPFRIGPCPIGSLFDYTKMICLPCPKNYFSINVNDTKCHPCPQNAFCPGGSLIELSTNYWRFSQFSLNIFECKSFFGNCPGGLPSQCSPEYTGILCNECASDFTRNIIGECVKCPELLLNLLTNIFLIVGFTVFLLVLTKFCSKENFEEETIFFVKIGIDYIHLSFITQEIVDHPLKSTWEVYYLYKVYRIFSLNCFFNLITPIQNNVLFSISSLYYFYYGLFFLFLLKMIFLVKNEKIKKEMNNVFYLYIYLSFPFWLNFCLNNLICKEVNGKSFLLTDTSIKCDETSFILVKYLILVPTIIFLIFVLPIIYLKKEFLKNSKKFTESFRMMLNIIFSEKTSYRIKRRQILLDFMQNFEKIVLIIVNSIEQNQEFRILICLIVLLVFTLFTVHFNRQKTRLLFFLLISIDTIFMLNKYIPLLLILMYEEIVAIFLISLMVFLKCFIVFCIFFLYFKVKKERKRKKKWDFIENSQKNMKMLFEKKIQISEI